MIHSVSNEPVYCYSSSEQQYKMNKLNFIVANIRNCIFNLSICVICIDIYIYIYIEVSFVLVILDISAICGNKGFSSVCVCAFEYVCVARMYVWRTSLPVEQNGPLHTYSTQQIEIVENTHMHAFMHIHLYKCVAIAHPNPPYNKIPLCVTKRKRTNIGTNESQSSWFHPMTASNKNRLSKR